MEKKNIYAICKKCGKRIRVQIDKDIEITREDQIYLIVHAHGELGKDAHALIIEVDKNLNVRNIRESNEFFLTFDI